MVLFVAVTGSGQSRQQGRQGVSNAHPNVFNGHESMAEDGCPSTVSSNTTTAVSREEAMVPQSQLTHKATELGTWNLESTTSLTPFEKFQATLQLRGAKSTEQGTL
jgi:hypothetical protein